MMILHIALRELRSLFLSPLAWTVLAVIQFILGWRFLVQLDFFFSIQPQLAVLDNAPGVTDLVAAPLFEFAGMILLLILPLMTMRLLSEERRSGSLKLLLSSPLSMTDIVLGKYLAMVIFIILVIALVAIMPLSLLFGTALDLGKMAAGMLGTLLMAAAFAAAGLYLSALTRYPTVAAVSSFGLLIMLLIIDAAGGNQQAGPLFSYLSIMRHNTAMLRGIIDSTDVAYYLLFGITFIALTIRQLDAQRLQK